MPAVLCAPVACISLMLPGVLDCAPRGILLGAASAQVFYPHGVTLVAAVAGGSHVEEARAFAQLFRYQSGGWPWQLARNESMLPTETAYHRAIIEGG